MVLGTWYKPEEPGPAEGKNICTENWMDRPRPRQVLVWQLKGFGGLQGVRDVTRKPSFWKAGLLREAMVKERHLEGIQRKELSGMFCSRCLSWTNSQSFITS